MSTDVIKAPYAEAHPEPTAQNIPADKLIELADRAENDAIKEIVQKQQEQHNPLNDALRGLTVLPAKKFAKNWRFYLNHLFQNPENGIALKTGGPTPSAFIVGAQHFFALCSLLSVLAQEVDDLKKQLDESQKTIESLEEEVESFEEAERLENTAKVASP